MFDLGQPSRCSESICEIVGFGAEVAVLFIPHYAPLQPTGAIKEQQGVRMDSSTGVARFGVALSSLRTISPSSPSTLTVRGAAACLALALVTTAQAALIDRGGGLIYDDVLDVTWLQDANYAKTSGYDSDGRMSWFDAKTWASNLVYGGFDDWRLASNWSVGSEWNYQFSNDGSTDYGYNITSPRSELSYMYYVNLGLFGYRAPDGTRDKRNGIYGSGIGGGQNDVGHIINIQGGNYWSGAKYDAFGSFAWYFSTDEGVQGGNTYTDELHAWAVRDGDVAPVPEPATLALCSLALAALVASRQRRLP